MSKRPTIEIWMPLHFADVTKACGRMSELEECVFIRLLRDAWLNGPARDDDKTLQKIARISRAKWLAVRVVLEPHFDRSSGQWIHYPTEERRQQALKVSEVKRQAADARHNAQSGDAYADAYGDAYADIRDLSSSSDRLVLTSPSQELSTDYQVSTTAEVIRLPVRGDGRTRKATQSPNSDSLARTGDPSGGVVAGSPETASTDVSGGRSRA